MKLSEKHSADKAVSAASFFKGEGNASALQILKNGHLKEHITQTPALLLCVEGHVVFENERGQKINLQPSEYVHIEPMVKHWVRGMEDSQLILFK